MITYRITGTPNTGVIAFNGIIPAFVGIVLIMLQIKARKEPERIVTGISLLWS